LPGIIATLFPTLVTIADGMLNTFQGEQVYGTICINCHNKSEWSTDFLELEINIEVTNALHILILAG
jgi:hypothetical protein